MTTTRNPSTERPGDWRGWSMRPSLLRRNAGKDATERRDRSAGGAGISPLPAGFQKRTMAGEMPADQGLDETSASGASRMRRIVGAESRAASTETWDEASR